MLWLWVFTCATTTMLRLKLATQFVPDIDLNYERARKSAFITAHRLVEQVVKQNEFAKKYLNAEVLSRQLSTERFATELKD